MNVVEMNAELKRHKTPRILLIDDDPLSYKTVEAQLFQDGYELLFQNNGIDAVRQVLTLHPDLILLDLLPGVNGFEVCQQLKSTPQLEHIPIIVFSALAGTENVTAGFAAGADEFLSKPVSRAKLRAQIRSMLRLKYQYNALQQTLYRRETFSRRLVHDMRNPLSGIVLYTQLLQKRGEFNAEQQQYLRSIYEEAQRLRVLLDQMQLLNKLQQGQHKLRRQLTDIRILLREVAAKHLLSAAEQGIEMVIDIPGTPVPPVFVDRSLMQHLFEILLSTAIRFTPAAAQIIIEMTTLFPAVTAEAALQLDSSPVLQITIIDQGPSLPHQVLDDLYKHVEDWDVLAPERTGMGVSLALCKMIAEVHEGHLALMNTRPEGAIFTIALPLAEAESYGEKVTEEKGASVTQEGACCNHAP